MGIHEGHRERLRERYAEHGLDTFNDLNVLELLLFYAIPRRDTNELAHALLDRFGTLDAVFDASIQQLEEVPGIGHNAALLINLIPQLGRRYAISRTGLVEVFDSSRAAARYLIPRLGSEKDEQALLLCLNPQKQLISAVKLAKGVVNGVNLNTRQVVETALKYCASSVILAHNHPSGNFTPSREDEIITRKVRDALKLVDIILDDHLSSAGRTTFPSQIPGCCFFKPAGRIE